MTETAADNPLDPDTLTHLLGYRPHEILNSMITIEPPEALTEKSWPPRISSLGSLDRLPPELVTIILSFLDLASTARFSSVCFLGRLFVRCSLAYRDLIILARETLFALGKLGLAGAHSAEDLHTALRATKCTSCNDYGPFLFLPTAERCCWECLRHNPQLRLLSLKDAKRVFFLSKHSSTQLPKIHIIPGRYGIAQDRIASEHCVLTSVAAARALGIREHGSLDKLADALSRKYKSGNLLSIGRFLQREPRPVAHGQDILLLPTLSNIPNDRFFGMGSIPFPSLLSPGHTELGWWCSGCSSIMRQYSAVRLGNDILRAIVPPECHPTIVLIGLERRAYSRNTFLRHIKYCYGAQKLVPGLKEYGEQGQIED